MSEEATAARLRRLEERIDQLESAEAIRDLQATYVRFLADRQWTAMLDLFDEGAVTEISFHGETRGKAALRRVFDQLSHTATSHDAYVLSSPVIRVDGDTASGTWTWTRHYCDITVPQGVVLRVFGPWMEGRYDCRYVRRDGRWLISMLRFHSVAPDPDLDAKVTAAAARR
jgi:hypothetical protein